MMPIAIAGERSRMCYVILPAQDTRKGLNRLMQAVTSMQKYILHLYVSGKTPRSLHAAANLRRLCERHLQANYEIVLVDVLEQPDLAESAHILATPTTIRTSPPPCYRVIGDLSDPAKVMMALGLYLGDTDTRSVEEEMS
jgi:circadian clock protein KaiB